MVLETPTARKRITSPAGRARRRAANGPCALGSGGAPSAMRMSWSVGSTVFSILSGGWRKPGKVLLFGCGINNTGTRLTALLERSQRRFLQPPSKPDADSEDNPKDKEAGSRQAV